MSETTLDWLFHPRSIAVVGVSDRKPHVKELFLNSQRNMGFAGQLYTVSNRKDAVSGYPNYARVSDIPGPVDHVILAVPAAQVRKVLEDCAAKGVRSVHAFTSGFAESDDPEGRVRQAEMKAWLKTQDFRFIGPNCMGLYCPDTGLAFRPDLIQEPGNISYASQSGGMTITGIFMAAAKGLRFSKAVSYGNEIDLSCAEILKYYTHDPDTELTWAYIEGTEDGNTLLEAMKEAAAEKPLLVLKGGSTESGGRAAASHTGAMAGSSHVWRSAIRQTGAILVESLEELVDSTMALSWLPAGTGSRLGLACISGGLSVNYTDQAIRARFEVPAMSPEMVAELKTRIDIPGTSVNNPLDLAAGFFNFEEFPNMFGAIDESGEIDAMVMVMALEYLPVHGSQSEFPDMHKLVGGLFKAIRKRMKRPFLVVMPPVLHEEMRHKFELEFLKARIPTYPSMSRALVALNNWRHFWQERG